MELAGVVFGSKVLHEPGMGLSISVTLAAKRFAPGGRDHEPSARAGLIGWNFGRSMFDLADF